MVLDTRRLYGVSTSSDVVLRIETECQGNTYQRDMTCGGQIDRAKSMGMVLGTGGWSTWPMAISNNVILCTGAVQQGKDRFHDTQGNQRFIFTAVDYWASSTLFPSQRQGQRRTLLAENVRRAGHFVLAPSGKSMWRWGLRILLVSEEQWCVPRGKHALPAVLQMQGTR